MLFYDNYGMVFYPEIDLGYKTV